MESIDQILSIGRKVDPVILDFLTRKVDPAFAPIIKHQIESGGKRVRATLTILSCMATGGELTDAWIPAGIFELVHNYSLIIDDIIDRGEFRRRVPTVRKKFSDDMALLAAMFYREALDEMAEAANPAEDIRRLTRETVKELIEGERRDVLFEQSGRESPYIEKYRATHVSVEDYMSMIGKKTAALIKASCMAGGYASKTSPKMLSALENFGWKIGLAFQVIDDYLDIFGEETGKERGKDIVEHKLGNIAIIYALNELDEEGKRTLMNILSSIKVSSEDLRQALALIERTDSKNQTFSFFLSSVMASTESKKSSLFESPLSKFP